MIEIKDLTFSYGEEKIFDKFCCDFQKGERVCISGVSGRGKTTLLRLITSLESEYDGQINCDKNTKIAVVFQDNVLLPWYTALENVKLVSNENLANKWLDKVNLQNSKNKYVDQLSGGMQRRVAIARALSFEADVLILDEAFKGLEQELKSEIMQMIMHEFKDKLVIFTSHDENEQNFMATRVINL